MKNVSLEEIARSLDEHEQMLKMLGYRLDIIRGTIPLHENIAIYRDEKEVGVLTHKDKNMYWLREKGEVLANENINNMRFSQVPKYNKKAVFHLIINDGKLKINCYNIFNKNYIALENEKFKFKKFKDFIKIEVIEDKFNILYPNRIDNNEEYTTTVNKIFGYDVISNIESYYGKTKVKTKKGV